MNALYGHDQSVADWVAGVTGKPFHPPFSAIGVINAEGRLIGGFVFTGFNGDGVELSIAGRGAVSRTGWQAALGYVFGQLGCSRLQMHTSVRNKKVCGYLGKFLPRRSYEGIARRFYGKENAVCYGLTVDDLAALRARWRI